MATLTTTEEVVALVQDTLTAGNYITGSQLVSSMQSLQQSFDNSIQSVSETDLSDYYNKLQTNTLISESIAGIETSAVSRYEFNQKVSEIHEQHTIDMTSLSESIANIGLNTDDYYTKTQVNMLISGALSNSSLYDLTKSYVDAEVAIVHEQHTQDFTAHAYHIEYLYSLHGMEVDGDIIPDSGNNNNNSSGIQEVTVESTSTVPFIVDTFSAVEFRSADYNFTVSTNSGFYAQKTMIMHDGSTVMSDTYSTLGTPKGTFTYSITGTNVTVMFSPESSKTQIKFYRTMATNDFIVDTTQPTASITLSGSFDASAATVGMTLASITSTDSPLPTFTIPANSNLSNYYEVSGSTVILTAEGLAAVQAGTSLYPLVVVATNNDGVTSTYTVQPTYNYDMGTTSGVLSENMFPLDLNVDTYDMIDLLLNNVEIDLGTVTSAGDLTRTLELPIDMEAASDVTLDAEQGTGNIDLETGTNTAVFQPV